MKDIVIIARPVPTGPKKASSPRSPQAAPQPLLKENAQQPQRKDRRPQARSVIPAVRESTAPDWLRKNPHNITERAIRRPVTDCCL